MSLNEQIYRFFNEARPRTKNAGVEDIERRPVGQGRSLGDRPRPYNAKEKLKTVDFPKEGPSSFKEGAVHEIHFIPAEAKVISPRKNPEEKKAKSDSEIERSSQKKVSYTIYRKITKQEYDKIKASPYPNAIYPSDKPEHSQDLYYVTFPLPLYGSRVHSATDLEVSIELIPLSDIYEKGVGVRNLPPKELNKYVTEVPKVRYPFSLEDLSFKYASNLTLEEADNVKNYVDSFTPNDKVEKIDRKKSKEILQSPERLAAIAASGFFSYSLDGGRLDGEELLKRLIKTHNDLVNPSLQNTYDYYLPKRLSAQGEELKPKTVELKETDPIIQSFLKDRKEKNLPPVELDKEYPIGNKKGFTVTLTNDDKTKARKKRAEDIKNFFSLMDNFIETFPDPKEKTIIKKSLIEDPENILQRRLTASDNANLYNIIKKAYEDMKTKQVKEANSTNVIKEEAKKVYAVEMTPGSAGDKLYIQKKVPRLYGPDYPNNTYKRSLDDNQVKSLQRSTDVKSVKPVETGTKGYLSTKSFASDKEKGKTFDFDPKNPAHVAMIVGKIKPGEKAYNVNVKFGDAKSEDKIMTLSQIEKLIPDVKLGKDIKQPFEINKFRGVSKDTGKKIYDTVKGVLSFNSTDPAYTEKDSTDDKKSSSGAQSSLPPQPSYSNKAGSKVSLIKSYYLVDKSDPENFPNGKLVKDKNGGFIGSDDRKEAKELAAKEGPDVVVYQRAEVTAKKVATDDKSAVKKPETLQYNYYLTRNGKVSKDTDGKAIGADTKEDLESIMNSIKVHRPTNPNGDYNLRDMPYFKDIKIVSKEELKSMLIKKQTPGVSTTKFSDYVKTWGKELNEALSKEDIAKLKNTRVSFTIQSDLDPDKQYNISDNIREIKEEKTKIILVLAEAGVVTFDKEGTGIFKYSKDNKEYQALNVPSDLSSIVKKALAPSKEPEAQLEEYIRKRIRQAIKEAEVSQYWGYQGKDVKKKRLEEYLKRYEWGFQDSDNPYVHSNGSAIHAIVSKLVHELEAMGVDAIAIFNSYAPEGYQVSDLDQLDYASDSPLGSQLTQPYNPDSLTARGGRVAEMNGPVPYKGQGADQLDRLVKDMSPKLKDAVKGKANAEQAKELLSVFRQVYKMSDDVADEEIYNKIKTA